MTVIGRDHVQKARDALDVALRSHDQSPRLYRGAMRAALEDLDAAFAADRGAVKERDEWRRISAEQQADYGQLQAENERLRAEVARLTTGGQREESP